jgi:hypothetical protein
MPLVSFLFRDDKRLQATLVSDSAHVTPGSRGEFVHKIQVAIEDLDGVVISPTEVASSFYGPSTAAAVLAFKRKRAIINRAYQTAADNIVGKMTIADLDKEMVAKQVPPAPGMSLICKKTFTPPNSARRLKRLV